MNVACSFFTHALDNVPKPWVGTWPGLVEILERTNRPRPMKPGDDPKKGLAAIAPATFEPLHRGKDEAQAIHLLGLDYDNAREEVIPGEFHKSGTPKTKKVLIANPVLPEDVSESLLDAGTAGYLWTTWSNRWDFPKFRAMVPLAEPVPVGLWSQASEWALGALGLLETRRGLDVGALRDVARIYFLPGHPEGPGAIWRQRIAGEALRIPLGELAAVQVPELPMLPHIRKERERRKLEGYAWAAPLPADLSTLRIADLLKAMNVKVGPERPYMKEGKAKGKKWRTHCPWADEHTGGLDDDSGFIIHEPGRWPTWSCSHGGHLHLSLWDVLHEAEVL